MSWDYFALFAIVALLFWGLGAFAAWRGKRPVVVYTLTCLGLAVFFSFIVGMWISLERPPMRTMGETRLWYSFFLPLAGIITYSRPSAPSRSSKQRVKGSSPAASVPSRRCEAWWNAA